MRQPPPSSSPPQAPAPQQRGMLNRCLSKQLQDLVQEAPQEKLHPALKGRYGQIEEEVDRHARMMAAIYAAAGPPAAAEDAEQDHSPGGMSRGVGLGLGPSPIRHTHSSAGSLLSVASSCDSAPVPFVGGGASPVSATATAADAAAVAGDGRELEEEDFFFDIPAYATAGPDDLSLLLDGAEPTGGRNGKGSSRQRPESGICRSPFLEGEAMLLDVEEDERADDLLETERLEKRIFIKAALQLLVERAATGPPSFSGADGQGASTTTTLMTTTTGGSLLLARTARMEEAGAGAKRSGFLRKANHHSMGTIWRTKFVEVYPGLLVYVDDDALLGRRKKSLPLHMGVCSVRPVPSKKNNIFELASRKGAKRLWMCASEEDRAEWLRAITEATLPAGLLGPEGLDGVGPYEPFLHDMRRYRDAKGALVAAGDPEGYRKAVASLLLETEEEELRVPFAWVRAQTAAADFGAASGEGGASASPQRPEHGGAGGGGGISRSGTPFASLGSGGQHHQGHNHHHGHRRPRTLQKQQGTAATPQPQPANAQGELAQLWKDMARDKVCINGRVFYGEGAAGPEAILGALARIILELAARARELEAMSACHTRPASPSPPPSLSGQPSQPQPQPQSHPLLSALTEVQVVAHTLEILLACNRTQSGGDTYACVEYLFRNHGLVVVCPYSSHAEPLQISLELLWDGDLAPHTEPHNHQPQTQHQHQPQVPSSSGNSNSGSRPSSINYSRAFAAVSAAAGPGQGPTKAPPAHQMSSLSRSNSFSSKATATAASASPASSTAATAGPPLGPSAAAATGESPQRPISSSASLALPFDPSAAAPGPTHLFTRPLPWSAPAAPNAPVAHAAAAAPHGGRGSHHLYHTFESALGTTAGAESVLSRTTATAATAPPFLEEAEAQRHRRMPMPAGPNSSGNGGAPRPVILVRVQANTSYKVCPLDPQVDDGSDIWATVSARFEQRFTVSGSGLAKSQELIRLRTVLAGEDAAGGSGGSADAVEPMGAGAGGEAVPSSWTSTASSVAALGVALEKQRALQSPLGSPEGGSGDGARRESLAEAAT